MATAHVRRSYDRRLRRLVQETGDVQLALRSGVPRSTARDWSRLPPRDVVTLNVASATEDALRKEVVALKERNAKLSAILRLVIVLLRVTGLTLARQRVADGAKKRRLIHAVERARKSIPLHAALRILGLSSTRYHAWRREEECNLDDASSCPRLSRHQLTSEEREAIKDMACSREFRHVPTGTLAILAQRLGRVFAAPSTWYRLVRRHRWRRPRSRVHPERPKLGIRASGPDQIWHIDTTMVRLLDGTRTYIHAVIDNFSRRILAWRAADRFNPTNTLAVLVEARKGILPERPPPTVLADAGVENRTAAVEELPATTRARPYRDRLLELGHRGVVENPQAPVALPQHARNARQPAPPNRLLRQGAQYAAPHSKFRGQTPDEVYFGTGATVPDALKARQRTARAERLETNRTVTCGSCTSEVDG